MRRSVVFLALAGLLILSSCAKKETADAGKSTAASASGQSAGGTHALVHLADGSTVPGVVVASTEADMTLAGDDGIERKIPLAQVKSVEYGGAPAAAAPPPPAPTTATYELPAGSQISVRTNEMIDSATAAEGQTFGAQVTRDAKDSNGDIVIPRGSSARILIKSAAKGGHFRGTSDLVLDLDSVVINGASYAVDTAAIGRKGKQGMGANRRTAEFTGGGAALGAIIGAIAGGGKGAAIGAGAGAGGGAVTQILTKGGSIKVPAESVLTFRLDQPLHVTAAQ